MSEMYKFTRNTLRVNVDKGSVLIPKASIERFGVWVNPTHIMSNDEWVEIYKVKVFVVIQQNSTTYTLWSKHCSNEMAAYNEANEKIEELQQEYEDSCL